MIMLSAEHALTMPLKLAPGLNASSDSSDKELGGHNHCCSLDRAAQRRLFASCLLSVGNMGTNQAWEIHDHHKSLTAAVVDLAQH